MFHKAAWECGLFVAALQMLAIVVVCYLRLVVEMYRRRAYTVGVLFTILFLLAGGGLSIGVFVGLPVGWKYSRDWGIRPWMAVWSLALVGSISNIVTAIWFRSMNSEEWFDLFGWLPPF